MQICALREAALLLVDVGTADDDVSKAHVTTMVVMLAAVGWECGSGLFGRAQ